MNPEKPKLKGVGMERKAKAKTATKKIEFVIEAPNAGQVFLAGTFNDWSDRKSPLKKNGEGIWRRTMMLPFGTYEYKFLVDGAWVEDPANDRKCENAYGSMNSIVCVNGAATSAPS
jgi:1,4-alpha-glucan branching enzyme